MRWLGSKSKIAKDILEIMLKDRDKNQYYVEPFCGGLGSLKFTSGPKRIASDVNPYIIAFYKALQNGWLPPKDVSERRYYEIRLNKESFPPHLVGFIGLNGFGGVFLGTYPRGGKYNYFNQHYNSIINLLPSLKGVEFHNCNFWKLPIPPKSIIYCDPPYKDTSGYKEQGIDFPHDLFWQWAREMFNKGHKIYVSELKAPAGWVTVYEKRLTVTINDKAKSKVLTDKLFKWYQQK